MYLIMKNGGKINFSHADVLFEFMALNIDEVVSGHIGL